MPIELQVPIETAYIDTTRVSIMVLHRVVIDDIDNRTDDGRGISRNAIQQRFQPSCEEKDRFNVMIIGLLCTKFYQWYIRNANPSRLVQEQWRSGLLAIVLE